MNGESSNPEVCFFSFVQILYRNLCGVGDTVNIPVMIETIISLVNYHT